MPKSITVSYEGKPSYSILLQQDYKKLPEEFGRLGYHTDRKVCIVTDFNLLNLHFNELENVIKSCFINVTSFSFPAGEAQKNLDTNSLWRRRRWGFDRLYGGYLFKGN